jgi:S-adenosylmethionine synthetase
MEQVILPSLGKLPFDKNAVYINPSGRFVNGGFEADTGLTGRKLMVDTYGGIIPHGGGALSGKDATKVDRSAAYMARYIAKNIVGARLAEECTVSLAYAIGKAEPVAVDVDTHDTGIYHDDIIREAVLSIFDLTPSGIIRALGLTKPIFAPAACYGHFTDDTFPWEQINRAHELRIVCNAIESEKKHDQR